MTRAPPRAAIVSLAGTSLDPGEAALLADGRPAGVILFKRNCAAPGQLGALTAAVRAAAGEPGLPILIDQEGGRVARLRPPHWHALPPMAAVGALAAADRERGIAAATAVGRVIAADLLGCGITVACAPVLDLAWPGATAAIGDRAFGPDPELAATLGAALANALMAAGVAPVMKHLPGHGRAAVDSHATLPRVTADLAELRASDLVPFRLNAGLPLAMTAHVVYEAIDPTAPATRSATVIRDIIRGEIGFKGLLLTDDLGMGALDGPLAERAGAALAAGCDLALYCGGDLAEAAAVLAAAPPLDPARAALWRAAAPAPRPAPDATAAAAALDRLLSGS